MERIPLTLAEVSRQHKVWIIDPVARCVQYIADEAVLGGLTQRAIYVLQGFESYLVLARKEIVRRAGRSAQLRGIDTLIAQQPLNAKLAGEHVSTDFALFNAHSLVAIWGALESCIEETATLILMNDALVRARMIGGAGKSGRLDPSIDDEEACRKLVHLWEIAQPRANTVGQRFERLLAFFGLSGALDPAIDAQLAEVNAIRNCLMHRRGIIDERAVREAPGLEPFLLRQVVINRNDYLRYHKTIGDYVVDLSRRVTESQYATPRPRSE